MVSDKQVETIRLDLQDWRNPEKPHNLIARETLEKYIGATFGVNYYFSGSLQNLIPKSRPSIPWRIGVISGLDYSRKEESFYGPLLIQEFTADFGVECIKSGANEGYYASNSYWRTLGWAIDPWEHFQLNNEQVYWFKRLLYSPINCGIDSIKLLKLPKRKIKK